MIIKKFLKISFIIFMICHVLLTSATILLGIRLSSHNPEYTSLMLYRKYFYNHDVRPVKFIPLKSIQDDIKMMTIATEDFRFYDHPGIDIEAIKRAYVVNRKVGYRMYGGSTITQQLTRTLFLIPKKLILRKYIEVYMSLIMELFLTKERILELYLNYCEWGKGIFGISMAAKHHFNKEIRDLTIDEITRLITILANPVDFSPYSFKNKRFLTNRYYVIKLRYYTYLKFQKLDMKNDGYKKNNKITALFKGKPGL